MTTTLCQTCGAARTPGYVHCCVRRLQADLCAKCGQVTHMGVIHACPADRIQPIRVEWKTTPTVRVKAPTTRTARRAAKAATKRTTRKRRPNKADRVAVEMSYTAANVGSFKAAVAWVAKAVGRDATRPHLHGVHAELAGDSLVLVATDGHRLHHATLRGVTGPASGAWWLTPADVTAIRRTKAPKADPVSFGASVVNLGPYPGNAVAVGIGERNEGFPPWRKLLLGAIEGNTLRAEVNAQQLATDCKLVAPGCGPRTKGDKQIGATLTIHEGRYKLASDKLVASNDASTPDGAAAWSANLYPPYLVDAMADVSATLYQLGELDPVVVTSEGRTALVMPRRA